MPIVQPSANPYGGINPGVAASAYGIPEYQQWAKSTFGQEASPEDLNTLGGIVGAPGANGQYSPEQWQQAQQWGTQQATARGWQPTTPAAPAPGTPGAAPFFPEFTPPTYTAPSPYVPQTYQGPGDFTAPASFSYGNFQSERFRPPTMAEAENDPGYQFSLREGQKALEMQKAFQGVSRTGGTLKDILNYGQDRGRGQYNDVYGRRLGENQMQNANARADWQGNRQNAAENYATNYGIARNTWQDNATARAQAWDRNYNAGRNAWTDQETANQGAFDRNYRGASDAFNARFRGQEWTGDDLFRRWGTQVDANTRLAMMNVE